MLSGVRNFRCPVAPARLRYQPSQPIVACDADGVRYLLTAASITDHVAGVAARIPKNYVYPIVQLTFDTVGKREFAELTRRTAKQNVASPISGASIAILYAGAVLAAPVNEGPITVGVCYISGPQDLAGSAARQWAHQVAGAIADGLNL